MSTRIDIEVAQALLSQRAREIAGLNREQRLERERKVKEEAAINAAADKGAEAALRNGNPGGGQSIGGGAAALDARAQRLGLRSGVPEYYTPPKVAATRRSLPSWLLIPRDADFKALTRGIRPFQFAEAYIQNPTDNNSSHFTQVSLAGPDGSNSIQASTSPTGNPLSGTKFYSSRLVGDSSINYEPRTKAFTFEMMGQIAALNDSDANQTEVSRVVVWGLHGFCQIQLISAWVKTANPSTYEPMGVLRVICVSTVNRNPNGYQNFSSGATGAPSLTYPSAVIEPSLNNYGQWHHVAIVQEPTENNGRELRFYFNGAKLDSLTIEQGALSDYLDIYASTFDDAVITSAYGDNNSAALETSSSRVHGVRFTPRALYRGETYTPPSSLLRLA